MLQFLYPAGLLGALGIIIPLIIHLWHIKSGKTLKIGSIALLADPANQRSSNMKITDWPLLLLRCLLMILLSALLAGPVYHSVSTQSPKQGIILLEKQSFRQVWQQYKKVLDSLVARGYDIRNFGPGFEKLELKDTATTFSVAAQRPLSYFVLLRQFDAQNVGAPDVYLFTGRKTGRFDGPKPYLHVKLHWQLLKEESASVPLPVKDKSALEILIYDNGQTADSHYVKAAVRAVADFTGRPLYIKDIRSFAQISKNTNIVFWLSDQQPSGRQIAQLPAGISFFTYAGSKAQALTSVIRDHQAGTLREAELYRRTSARDAGGQAIWSDGFGEPLLTLDSVHHSRYYRFYSRFNQEWTDLVWSDGLVSAIMPLIVPHDHLGFDPETSAAKAVDSVPVIQTVAPHAAALSAGGSQKPLSAALWWVVFLVLAVERIWSYSKLNRSR